MFIEGRQRIQVSAPTLPDNTNIGMLAEETKERFTEETVLDQKEYADRGSSGGGVRSGHLVSFWSR